MSDAELTVDDKPLSPIQIFCTKVVVVTAAALVMFYFADAVIESSSRIFLPRRRKQSSMPFENSRLNTNHISTH
jgi:hypothetical protein